MAVCPTHGRIDVQGASWMKETTWEISARMANQMKLAAALEALETKNLDACLVYDEMGQVMGAVLSREAALSWSQAGELAYTAQLPHEELLEDALSATLSEEDISFP